MALVVVSLRVMPESVEVSLERLKKKVEEKIKEFAGESEVRVEEEPIGFGLSSLKFIFVIDERKSNLEPLEESIKEIGGVRGADVVDVRRAIG